MHPHTIAGGARAPRVAVIVLNWNGLADTRACAASLTAQTYAAATVYLVDNASTDGSASALQNEFPEFVHVANQENLGFTGGNNLVMARALSDPAAHYQYVLLLNNDTTVAPDFLTHLVRALENNPDAGMAGPKIFYASQPNVLWYAGGIIDWRRWTPFTHRGEREPDTGQYDRPGETDFITGCCLLVRAEVIRQIGTLDPVYGYYCEDVDWCLRAQRAGWRLLFEPRAHVWHKINASVASGSHGSARTKYYGHRNPALAARRHLGWWAGLPVALRAAGWALRHQTGDAAARPALLEAAFDALTGKRTGVVEPPGASTLAQTISRVLAPPLRLYWWASARLRRPPRPAV